MEPLTKTFDLRHTPRQRLLLNPSLPPRLDFPSIRVVHPLPLRAGVRVTRGAYRAVVEVAEKTRIDTTAALCDIHSNNPISTSPFPFQREAHVVRHVLVLDANRKCPQALVLPSAATPLARLARRNPQASSVWVVMIWALRMVMGILCLLSSILKSLGKGTMSRLQWLVVIITLRIGGTTAKVLRTSRLSGRRRVGLGLISGRREGDLSRLALEFANSCLRILQSRDKAIGFQLRWWLELRVRNG